MAYTTQRDKNTRSKYSTKVTSSATTSSIPLSQRKTLSSALALDIRASCACIGHFRMIGVSVRCLRFCCCLVCVKGRVRRPPSSDCGGGLGSSRLASSDLAVRIVDGAVAHHPLASGGDLAIRVPSLP